MRLDLGPPSGAISEHLRLKLTPSLGLEARLFTSANELLSHRRDIILQRQNTKKTRASLASRLHRPLSAAKAQLSWPKNIKISFFNPLATSAAFLLLCFSIFTHLQMQKPQWHWGDLPDFPKTNDGPEQYDSLRLSEQTAYQKEVDRAHDQTRGGL